MQQYKHTIIYKTQGKAEEARDIIAGLLEIEKDEIKILPIKQWYLVQLFTDIEIDEEGDEFERLKRNIPEYKDSAFNSSHSIAVS